MVEMVLVKYSVPRRKINGHTVSTRTNCIWMFVAAPTDSICTVIKFVASVEFVLEYGTSKIAVA